MLPLFLLFGGIQQRRKLLKFKWCLHFGSSILITEVIKNVEKSATYAVDTEIANNISSAKIISIQQN